MKKLSSLAKMGIAHECFGNPIPQQAYDLIEAVEKAIPDFNPYIDVGNKIRALMGYVQNGSDIIVSLYQDDATHSYCIIARNGSQTIWSEHNDCFITLINNAYEKHAEKFQ